MLLLRKTAIFSLILTTSLVLSTAVCAETVEYDGLIEPYVVVDIGARMKKCLAWVGALMADRLC